MSSWSKRLIINEALDEIGISSYDFDSTAYNLQTALRRLDSMMAIWIDLSIIFEPDPYPYFTDVTLSDLDQDTNAPGEAISAMFLNLAVRLAPGYGKSVSRETKIGAKLSFNNLLGNYAIGVEQDFGSFLVGAGAKRAIYPWNHDNEVPVDINDLIVIP